jgi:hypothetical protein
MGSMLLLELGSKVVMFMFLLVHVVESTLMLGSKVKVISSGLLKGSVVTMVEVLVGSGLMVDLFVTMVEVVVGSGLMEDLLVTNVDVFLLLMHGLVEMPNRGGQVMLFSGSV